MTPLNFLILAAATWRVAYFAAKEAGPFHVGDLLRRIPGGPGGCIYCWSFWAALLVYLMWLTPLTPFVVVLALSGASLLVWRYVGGA